MVRELPIFMFELSWIGLNVEHIYIIVIQLMCCCLITPTAPVDPPDDSMEFSIDSNTGVISAVTDNPSMGTHSLDVIAFNSSNPDSSVDFAKVTVLCILLWFLIRLICCYCLWEYTFKKIEQTHGTCSIWYFTWNHYTITNGKHLKIKLHGPTTQNIKVGSYMKCTNIQILVKKENKSVNIECKGQSFLKPKYTLQFNKKTDNT